MDIANVIKLTMVANNHGSLEFGSKLHSGAAISGITTCNIG